jgi:hypothetical protein
MAALRAAITEPFLHKKRALFAHSLWINIFKIGIFPAMRAWDFSEKKLKRWQLKKPERNAQACCGCVGTQMNRLILPCISSFEVIVIQQEKSLRMCFHSLFSTISHSFSPLN